MDRKIKVILIITIVLLVISLLALAIIPIIDFNNDKLIQIINLILTVITSVFSALSIILTIILFYMNGNTITEISEEISASKQSIQNSSQDTKEIIEDKVIANNNFTKAKFDIANRRNISDISVLLTNEQLVELEKWKYYYKSISTDERIKVYEELLSEVNKLNVVNN